MAMSSITVNGLTQKTCMCLLIFLIVYMFIVLLSESLWSSVSNYAAFSLPIPISALSGANKTTLLKNGTNNKDNLLPSKTLKPHKHGKSPKLIDVENWDRSYANISEFIPVLD